MRRSECCSYSEQSAQIDGAQSLNVSRLNWNKPWNTWVAGISLHHYRHTDGLKRPRERGAIGPSCCGVTVKKPRHAVCIRYRGGGGHHSDDGGAKNTATAARQRAAGVRLPFVVIALRWCLPAFSHHLRPCLLSELELSTSRYCPRPELSEKRGLRLATDMFRACLPPITRPRASTLSKEAMHRRPGVWVEFLICTSIVPLRAAGAPGCLRQATKHVSSRSSPASTELCYTRHYQVLGATRRLPPSRGAVTNQSRGTPPRQTAVELLLKFCGEGFLGFLPTKRFTKTHVYRSHGHAYAEQIWLCAASRCQTHTGDAGRNEGGGGLGRSVPSAGWSKGCVHILATHKGFLDRRGVYK